MWNTVVVGFFCVERVLECLPLLNNNAAVKGFCALWNPGFLCRGGVFAEIIHVSERSLGLALHIAAGIVLAVVGIELMPEALTVDPA